VTLQHRCEGDVGYEAETTYYLKHVLLSKTMTPSAT